MTCETQFSGRQRRMVSKNIPGRCSLSPPHLIRCVVFGSLEISKDMFGQNCIFTAWPFGTLIPPPCPSSCTEIGLCSGVYTSPSIAAALLVFSCCGELCRAKNGMTWWRWSQYSGSHAVQTVIDPEGLCCEVWAVLAILFCCINTTVVRRWLCEGGLGGAQPIDQQNYNITATVILCNGCSDEI